MWFLCDSRKQGKGDGEIDRDTVEGEPTSKNKEKKHMLFFLKLVFPVSIFNSLSLLSLNLRLHYIFYINLSCFSVHAWCYNRLTELRELLWVSTTLISNPEPAVWDYSGQTKCVVSELR